MRSSSENASEYVLWNEAGPTDRVDYLQHHSGYFDEPDEIGDLLRLE